MSESFKNPNNKRKTFVHRLYEKKNYYCPVSRITCF